MLPFYWIDAFTRRAFTGNPAAVVPLETWLPDALLKRMAWQHRLSETAFLVPLPGGGYHLRWFTPDLREVDLCGHATLASAHVLFNELGVSDTPLRFDSRSGPLTVTRDAAGRLELDFPARPPRPLPLDDLPAGLLDALGLSSALSAGLARDYLIVLRDQSAVAAVQPDFTRLAAYDAFAFIVTAPGDDCDFVSRFFAPRSGIDEDPVTGSAHCTLVPYWADRLERRSLHARQISARGGELWCELRGDRVALAGHAVTYLRGTVALT